MEYWSVAEELECWSDGVRECCLDHHSNAPILQVLIVRSAFEFQFPWLLGLLALLPVYAILHGRIGKLSALRFPSADIARAAGSAARAAPGRLLLFLRTLTVGLCIVALAGPRFANDHTETQASGVDIMLALDLSWSMMAQDMASQHEHVSR